MSDSMLPPVMVEFGGTATKALAALTKMSAGLDRFAKAAAAAADAADAAWASIEKGAAALESVAAAADVAKKSMAGLSRSSNAVAKAVDKAATASEAGMTAISASAEKMAVSVDAASTTAATGVAALGAESRATATALRTTATASEASGVAAAASGSKIGALGSKFLGLGAILSKLKTLGPLSLGAIAIASLDLGSKFQSAMTKLSTAAGAPIKQVDAMKASVISTGQSVGMTGTEMATALYHPVSAGLSLSASLQAVKYAAQEAQISGASLEDTTYGLSSVMKSFNLGAAQAGPTMAQLNAIVGEGDMRFQDLNSSVKNWVPTAATFGVSLSSAGAALDYFTDRGDSASTAGTKLSLIMTQMAGPSKQAASIYKVLGLTQGQVTARTKQMASTLSDAGVTQTKLAADLRQPDGIVVALTDLKSHLEASGMSAGEANSALVRAFGGGKQFKGVAELIQNIQGVKTKYDAITKDSTPAVFAAAWAKTTKTLSYQWTEIKSGAENLGIKLGTALIPQVSKFLSLLESKGKPVVASFSSALSGIASGFEGPKTPVKPTVGPTMPGKTSTGALFAPTIPPPPPLTAWQKVGKTFSDITSSLVKFGSQVGTSFSNLMSAAGPTLAFLGGAGLVALKSVGSILANVVGPALVAVTGFLASHKTLVEGVVLGYVAYKSAMLGLAVVTKGVELATKAAAAAQVLLDAAMDANPIGLVVLAIAALVGGLILLWRSSQTARNIMTEVFVAMAVPVLEYAHIALLVFQQITVAFMAFASATLSMASKAFGWVPGIGGKLKQAANDVNNWKNDANAGFSTAIGKVNEWTAAVEAMPNKIKIDGQIDDLTKKIDAAKKQLSDKNLPAKKQITLQANITQWQQQVTAAKMSLQSTPEKKQAVLTAQITNWQSQIDAAKKQLLSAPASKKAVLTADIGQLSKSVASAQAEINSLRGKTVQITYKGVNEGSTGPGGSYTSTTGSSYANGGIRYAADGLMNSAMMAPGGSNILWAEKSTQGESFIPHARSKRPRSRQIAAKTVGILGGQVMWNDGTGAQGSGAAGAMASYSALGAAIPAGVAAGVSGAAGAAHAAVQSLAKGTIDVFSQELGIASPSKKFRSLGAYVIDGLVQGLTGSTASVKAATKRISSDLYVDFGTAHKSLQKAVDKDNSKLLSLAAKRDSVATKLKAANKALAAVQKEYSDEQKSVADSIMQSNSVVMAAPDDGSTLTSFQVIDNMQQQMQKTLQFAANLKAAQKNGLSAALVAQIAASGVDAGGATAAALATATKGQIKQLNGIQSQTQKAANSVGSAVADSMYSAGIKSAQGLVKGLKSQEKSIDAEMLKIAKSMQAAIKKALGIKSPSRVFSDLGQFIPQGLAQGISGGTHHATGAVMTMSKAVVSAGSQRTYAYAGSHGPSGGGGVTQVINVNVTVEGNVTSEKKLAENLRAILLRKGSVNPQTWPNFKR